MRIMSGDPKFTPSQDLPPFNYAAYAESLGLRGIRVERADQLDEAWREAFSADRPVLFEAVVDPNFPTLPPHITFDEAKKFVTSMAEGDVDRVNVVKESVRAVADAVFHPGGDRK
jgi:pyruvate dehydrogenase (quinone)